MYKSNIKSKTLIMDRTVLLVSALMACGFSYSEAHTILTKKAESDYAARVEA